MTAGELAATLQEEDPDTVILGCYLTNMKDDWSDAEWENFVFDNEWGFTELAIDMAKDLILNA